MPTSIVLPLHVPRGTVIDGRGNHAQACLLAAVREHDAGLAKRLHDDDADRPSGRPFTSSWLPPDRALRFTSLDPLLDQVLAELAQHPPEVIRLGRVACAVDTASFRPEDHPLSARATWFDLVSRSARAPANRMVLRFLTPTAFRAACGRTHVFPDGPLVFRRLAERWAGHGGPPLPADLLEELLQGVYVEGFDLRSSTMTLTHRTEVGCTGRCTYAIAAPSPGVAELFSLLCRFAFYAGVGLRTTMGMGVVVPERP